jgi:hypothetical protein
MAGAGVAMLLIAFIALERPAAASLVTLLAVSSLLTAAYALPAGELGRLNADWLALALERSPQLFLSNWPLDDWGRAGVVATTLVIGAFSLDGHARRLFLSAALTMVVGIALTWLACDILRLTLIIQMQPWRWQWIATLTSAVGFPFIALSNWGRGTAGRTNALLLLAVWMFGVGEFGLITCLTALLSLSFGRLKPRELQLVFAGSCAVLALAVIWRIASNLEFADIYFMDTSLPRWFRRSASLAHDGLVPALVIAGAAWIGTTRRAVIGSWIYTTLTLVAIAAIWPVAWRAWTREEFPKEQIARFVAWRNIIATSDEVLWPESPLSSWVLLNRANYLSSEQTSGLIFTRASALEFQRRALALSGLIPTATFLSWDDAGEHLSLSPQALRGICRLGAFAYLVTNADLGIEPVSVIDQLKLYRCAP